MEQNLSKIEQATIVIAANLVATFPNTLTPVIVSQALDIAKECIKQCKEFEVTRGIREHM